jgi:hypothetical protein
MTATSEIVMLIDYDVKPNFRRGQPDPETKLFSPVFVIFNYWEIITGPRFCYLDPESFY